MSGWARLDQSGRPNRFGPWDGCGRRAERTERALLDRVGGATAGRFVDLQEAGAVLAESQPEWRASLGWSQLVPFSRPEPGPDRCHSRDFGRQRPRDPAETDSAAEGGGSNFPFRVVNEHRTAPIGFLLTMRLALFSTWHWPNTCQSCESCFRSWGSPPGAKRVSSDRFHPLAGARDS